MENLEIREFQHAIIKFVNESPLSIETRRIALLNIVNQVEREANEIIQGEILERDKKVKEDGVHQELQSDNLEKQ